MVITTIYVLGPKTQQQQQQLPHSPAHRTNSRTITGSKTNGVDNSANGYHRQTSNAVSSRASRMSRTGSRLASKHHQESLSISKMPNYNTPEACNASVKRYATEQSAIYNCSLRGAEWRTIDASSAKSDRKYYYELHGAWRRRSYSW
jgi:hypothetical protein